MQSDELADGIAGVFLAVECVTSVLLPSPESFVAQLAGIVFEAGES